MLMSPLNLLFIWRWPILLNTVSLLLPTTILRRFHAMPPAATLASSSNDDLLLRRVFQLIDADGDGQLSPAELHQHLCKLGLMDSFQGEFKSLAHSLLPTKHLQFHDFKLLYQALCATTPLSAYSADHGAAVEDNCSHSSSCLAACNGFYGGICCCHAASEESCHVGEDHVLPDAFAVFDVNGDGKISVEELRQVLVRMGFTECQNEAFCASIVSTFDSNSDGYIDFSEFCVMMNKA